MLNHINKHHGNSSAAMQCCLRIAAYQRSDVSLTWTSGGMAAVGNEYWIWLGGSYRPARMSGAGAVHIGTCLLYTSDAADER